MDNENKILAIRKNAKAELMSLKTVEEGMEQLNKIKGIEAWAIAEKLDAELQVIVKEQSLRTQRIIGKLIAEGQKAGEIASQENNQSQYGSNKMSDPPKKITDLGLTHRQSSDFKKLAAIPEEIFEEHIADAKEEVQTAVNKLTTAGTIRLTEVIDEKRETVKTASAIAIKLQHEERVSELVKEINAMPIMFRLKIKQAIKA